MPFGVLPLTIGLITAGSGIASGIIGSNAAHSAADQQTKAEQQALDFQKQIWGQEQQNIQPWLNLGTSSIGNLMGALPGLTNIPNAPTAPGPFTGSFHTPTLNEAMSSPGYAFTAQQGSKSILQGAAAAGGAISGGTLKALDQYNTGLANQTYGDVFNRSLQAYNTGLQGYQANLQGYQAGLQGYSANLAKNAQIYNELFAPVQLGENAVTGINSQGQAVAQNVGQLMGNIGSSQAAGTIGGANALTAGINSGTNGLLESLLLSGKLGIPGGSQPVLAGNLRSGTGYEPVGTMAPISVGMGPG